MLTFRWTANSATSDPDNVYLYANELIQALTSLSFSGRVDDIYMESKTIHIKNTSFPATSDVMLRSQAGSVPYSGLRFKYCSRWCVNMTNVSLGISNENLTRTPFEGIDGHMTLQRLTKRYCCDKIRGQ